MKTLKEHILFKLVAIFIVVALLIPSTLKFSHIFTHHKHDICFGKKTTHLHELNVDCDIYKFKLSHSYTIYFPKAEVFHSPLKISLEILAIDFFASSNNKGKLSLRAPPFLFNSDFLTDKIQSVF